MFYKKKLKIVIKKDRKHFKLKFINEFSFQSSMVGLKHGSFFGLVGECDGTYCRFVHIVVGDNMYRP